MNESSTIHQIDRRTCDICSALMIASVDRESVTYYCIKKCEVQDGR